MHVVVVGGGVAGVVCAQELLARGAPHTRVTLIAPSHSVKMVCAIERISDHIETFSVEERDAEEFAAAYPGRLVSIRGSVRAVEERHVVLSEGQRIPFDRLCLCTGAIPKQLGNPNARILSIRDTESIASVRDAVASADTVCVVGNGGIALELAHELKGIRLIWAIRHDSIGTNFFDADSAAFLLPRRGCVPGPEDRASVAAYVRRIPAGALESIQKGFTGGSATSGCAIGPAWKRVLHGDVDGVKEQCEAPPAHVDILYNCEVQDIHVDESAASNAVSISLHDGRKITCDILINAIGVNPISDIVKGICDVHSDGGIIVDARMQTSKRYIFAAGDCCHVDLQRSLFFERDDKVPFELDGNGEYWFQMRLWSQARAMGRHAAHCILNIEDQTMSSSVFDLFAHTTSFFGTKCVFMGLFSASRAGHDASALVRETRGSEYVKVVLRDGRMCGAVLLGASDLTETFEHLILDGIDLSRYGDELLDPEVDLEDYFD